jgi:hypothetical protein
MTFATCLNCGKIHWGALCPCEECGFAVTVSDGDLFMLAIHLSDHYYSYEDLEEFERVYRGIAATGVEPNDRLDAFLHYVLLTRPGGFQANYGEERAAELEDILRSAGIAFGDGAARGQHPAKSD